MFEHFHLMTPLGRAENTTRVYDSIKLAFEDPDAVVVSTV